MCASFSGSLTRLERTARRGELWIACNGTGVSTSGRAHGSPVFCCTEQEVQHMGTVFICSNAWRYVHDGEPIVILQVSFRIRKKKERETEKKFLELINIYNCNHFRPHGK